MAGTIRIKVPRLLKERGIIPFDLVRQAGIAPGTAYKLADEKQCAEMSGITFDVLIRLCTFFGVGVSEIMEFQEE